MTMDANVRKPAESSIPEFNIDDAAGILAKLHERLKTARSSGTKFTGDEKSAISAAVSFLSIKSKGPGPMKPKPK